MNRVIFTLFAFLSSFALMSQGSVNGYLIDAENNEPLIGASIIVEGTTTGTNTDFNGYFSLQLTEAGATTLTFRYLGYEDVQQTVDVPATGTKTLGKIKLTPSAVGLEEIKVVASIATDRKTPVAVSSVSSEVIETKVGNQEFPEILRSSPSIYATKQGGGFGDSRINVRGFDQRNIAVMINGIPVNDMENGWIYWSNWAGLSDVTKTIQVQRGLGASKLAISSVGGTINMITKTTDMNGGASAYSTVGNNGFLKFGLTLSSGRLDSGWAFTFSGSRTTGKGWVDATWIDAWSYFGSISKEIGDNHMLVLTAIGAPQQHGQRSFKEALNVYTDSVRGPRYNSDWGMKDGEIYSIRKNFYHKPQFALNHYWTLSPLASISTSAYYSIGRGGGTGDRGSIDGRGTWGFRNNDGIIRVDDIARWNTGTNNIDGFPANGNLEQGANGYVIGEKNGLILRSSKNEHNWFGLLSTANIDLTDQLNLIAGVDIRGYTGLHYRVVNDLLGADAYLDPRDVNNQDTSIDLDGDGTISSKETGALKQVGDKIHYDNDGVVNWQGVFAQLEYSTDFGLTVFGAGSLANTSLKRIDRFQYTGEAQTSEALSYLGGTAKLGANYNINKYHNVFINTGYFSRAPSLDVVFPSFNNDPNKEAKNENVIGIELGYGLRAGKVAANVNVYNTIWSDKTVTENYNDAAGNELYANVSGLNATHRGIEFDLSAKPVKGLNLGLVASIGDWKWTNDVSAVLSDDNDQIIDTLNIYSKNLKVGDAAQTQFGANAKYTFPFGLSLDADFVFYDNLYAKFSPEGNSSPDPLQPLKLPSYNLLDLGIGYKINFDKIWVKLRANVNNVLDASYIAEADNNNARGVEYGRLIQDANGFWGLGRTWNVGLKVGWNK